jgi:hypothetical protein
MARAWEPVIVRTLSASVGKEERRVNLGVVAMEVSGQRLDARARW